MLRKIEPLEFIYFFKWLRWFEVHDEDDYVHSFLHTCLSRHGGFIYFFSYAIVSRVFESCIYIFTSIVL